MKRFFVPAVIGLLLLAPLPSRADGYWVLKESPTSSSQTKDSKKLKWKISSGKAEIKDLGLTYTWEAPPKKIRWGTEEDIQMRINVMYASFAAEGKSMAAETEMTFSLIGDADKILKSGPDVPSLEIGGEGLYVTTNHALEEAIKGEMPLY